MPLFDDKLDAIADDELAVAGTLWLHTAAPTNASPTNGRTSVGGGDYESGMAITAGNWTTASNGDVNLNIAAAFGTADEAVGTVGWWSFVTPTQKTSLGERCPAPPSAAVTPSPSTPARFSSTARPPRGRGHGVCNSRSDGVHHVQLSYMCSGNDDVDPLGKLFDSRWEPSHKLCSRYHLPIHRIWTPPRDFAGTVVDWDRHQQPIHP